MRIARRLFGPSRKEIWLKLSEEVNGRFVEGGFLGRDKVEVEHGGWTLTLDTYVVSTGKVILTFTRMRAPYVNPDGFRFTVYRKSIFSGLGKLLGMQDIEIGDPPFDEGFIVKATDEPAVRMLLANATIRDLLSKQKDIQLVVKDDEGWFGTKFPEGVDEVYFVTGGTITDIDRLKLLYDLFAETLDELCRIGAASRTPPDVRVK